jgi:CubicO group peptidase (beta-lactamase class C family)
MLCYWLPMARYCLLLFLLGRLYADQFDGIRESIRRQLVDTQAPSIAVAVAKDGRIVWEQGFGWADREKRFAADEHTMYSLASISKPITATGLMTLVQAGKINLDHPVNEYLGNAKLRGRAGDAAQATVRRVANHSSGLPLHYQFFYADEPYRPPSMDETILRYGNLVTVPGEKYEYSNLGFGILDYAISRVSGKPYEDFMRQEVFLQLGLTHTSVGIGPGLERYEAVRYGADGMPIAFYDFDHRGASAIYSSAHDLVRFGLFHLKAHLADQKAILSDASIDAMHESTMSTANNSGYGIGWATADRPDGYHVVSHTGGMGGVATTLRLVPSEKLAVVVLCNAGVQLPHRIADEILAVLLPKWKQVSPGPQQHGKFPPTPELLGNWTGKLFTYKTEIPLTLRILDSGDVHAQLGGQMKMLWNDVTWRDGYLSGRMPGDIGAEDAGRRPYFLSFSLKLRGDVLNGAASAISLPGRRAGNALSQWVELTKQ